VPQPLGRFLQLALGAACVALVPPSAYGQSLKEQLHGTWTIVSAARVVGGVEEPDFLGQDPVGRFMFAPDGHMCFNAMRRNRSKFVSPSFQAATSEEKSAAYDSYIGYCGRYEVNEQERSIVMQFELSSFPNWTGTTQNRFVDVTGTRLRISTPPRLSEGKEIVNTILWERVK
jgi:lipocalin-like protein